MAGYFDYASAPEIFLGRTGSGPLHMAWDTNILIDYLKFGETIWGGGEIDIEESGHRLRVEAMASIMNPLYVFWDIRIHLFDKILRDAKKNLSIERLESRERALEYFAKALRYPDWDEELDDAGGRSEGQQGALNIDGRDPGPGQMAIFGADPATIPLVKFRSDAARELILASPKGHDRILVEEAINRRMHVFLTDDRGIRRRRDLARECRLLVVNLVEFCDLVKASGISSIQFPSPDLARMSKVISALSEIGGQSDA